MALNFPNSPSLNDIHEESGTKWQWDGSSWVRIVSAGNQGFQGVIGAQGAAGTPGGAQGVQGATGAQGCLLYTSPSPRDLSTSRMPSSA